MMNIRIYDTATTKRFVIETSARNFGQLKSALADTNTPTQGKKVCIGEQDRELINDSDPLPDTKLSNEQGVDFTVYLYPQKTKSGH